MSKRRPSNPFKAIHDAAANAATTDADADADLIQRVLNTVDETLVNEFDVAWTSTQRYPTDTVNVMFMDGQELQITVTLVPRGTLE